VSPPILRGLAIGSVVRLELADAREHGVALLAAAEGDQDSMLIVEAEYVLGVTSFWAGEFQESRRHLEEAIERYSPERHEAHIALYSQDPKVVCLSRLAWTLRFLGYPDQAVRTRDAALSLADELGHPFSRCYASVYAAIVSQDLQDELRAEEFIEATETLATDERFRFLQMFGVVLRYWSLARTGDRRAIDAMEAAIGNLEETGQPIMSAYFLSGWPRVPLGRRPGVGPRQGDRSAGPDAAHRGPVRGLGAAAPTRGASPRRRSHGGRHRGSVPAGP